MKVETFSDVLIWTRDMHRNLAACIEHCANEADSERVRMLMHYLSQHEKEMARVLQLTAEDASSNALDTWVYDYFANAQTKPRVAGIVDFKEKSTDEILNIVIAFHEEVISLYEYMAREAVVPTTRELIEGLLALELQEAKRLVTQSRRLDDL